MGKHTGCTSLQAMRQSSDPFRHKLGQTWPPLPTETNADGMPLSPYEQEVADYAELWALNMQLWFPGRHTALPEFWTRSHILAAAHAAGKDELFEQVHHDAAALLVTHWVFGAQLRQLLYPETVTDNSDTMQMPMAS